MSLRTPKASESKNFDPAPAGWHMARCFAIIDLGTHYDEKWDKMNHLVRLGWELPKTKREDGKPFSVWKRYTLSHHEKAQLRKDLEAWYGKRFDTAALNDAGGFDLGRVLSRPAYVNIMHEERGGDTFANISAIGPVPSEMPECPKQMNDSILFSLSEFNAQTFEQLSDKTKQQIQRSKEWEEMHQTKQPAHGQGPTTPAPKPGSSFADMDDDIPF